MSGLNLATQISTTIGWLSLEDEASGYELHAESFASRSFGHRTVDITSGFQEGTYTVRSVREQVMERLVVIISADDSYGLRQRMDALTTALDALTYQVQVTIGTLRETWTCGPADYTIESSAPLLFATTVVVRAQVPRLPSTLLERVTP